MSVARGHWEARIQHWQSNKNWIDYRIGKREQNDILWPRRRVFSALIKCVQNVSAIGAPVRSLQRSPTHGGEGSLLPPQENLFSTLGLRPQISALRAARRAENWDRRLIGPQKWPQRQILDYAHVSRSQASTVATAISCGKFWERTSFERSEVIFFK